MKIDGIALLQMIKDNKIKNGTKILEIYCGISTKHIIKFEEGELLWNPGDFLVSDLYNKDYTFEILEDKPKKIEHIRKNENRNDKINEIIDGFNYLLEKSD